MALTDEQIREAGILYLAPQKYLKNPFVLPEEEEKESGGGVAFSNVPQTGGRGVSTLPAGNLLSSFEDAVSARQKRLTSPNPFAQKL